MLGLVFQLYNGKKFIPITISEDMVGHKFGEFAPTRQFFGHTPADKKAKEAAPAAEKKLMKKENNKEIKLVKAINKNIRSSTRKLIQY